MHIEKYIYKITNNANGKVCIGQTINPEKRWQDHQYQARKKSDHNMHIHNSMRKFGINNFSFEILEKCEDFNFKEKFWISFYNSNNSKFGYNKTEGGLHPPILCGDNCSLTKYSEKTMLEIQKELILNKLPFSEISDKYNITVEYLSQINRGVARHNDKFAYPLRRYPNILKDKETVNSVIHELIYSYESIESIQRKLGIDSNTIYLINEGKHRICPDNIEYPIRNKFNKMSNIMINQIYDEIKNSGLMFAEISNKYSIPKVSLSRINQGKKYKKDGYQYPIRKSNQRVYKRNL